MNSILFIESEQLGGTLESAIRVLYTYKGKRERQREVARLARIFRDLHFIGKANEVSGIAYGSRSDGSVGVFITYGPAIKNVAAAPAEEPQ